jgi:dihydrofolate synthase/folylpolyglutamate synthase
MEQLLPLAATVTLTAPPQPRATSAETLALMARHFNGRVFVASEPSDALRQARALAAPEDVVFVTGSLYLVGDIRRHWMEGRAKDE